MTPFHVVAYTSLTVIAFIFIFALFYWFKTRNVIKLTEQRNDDLAKELKPGMQVVCAGGLIGTFEKANKDKTIASVKLSNGAIIEVAYYSISNILL